MKFILALSLSILGALWIPSVLASCSVDMPAATGSMPLLGGNITAGEDLAIGSVLYQQRDDLDFSTTAQQRTITCTSTGQIMANYVFTQTPEPVSAYGSGEMAGKVYETGISGIGIVFSQGSEDGLYMPGSQVALHDRQTSEPCDPTSKTCNASSTLQRWIFKLIKTGPISAGALLGQNLPCMALYYTNSGNAPSNMIENVCMTGSINIVAGTCQTPSNINVDLGSYDIIEFDKKGSTQKWVDSSIKLTNCPQFYGKGAQNSWFADGSSDNIVATPTNNILRLKLTPNTDVIDDTNGIFSIVNNSNSAQGVGIQLGYGEVGGSVEPVVFSSTRDYTMDLNSNGVSEIPLVARYIQTDNSVQAGKAAGAVTYLIDYY